LPGPGRVYKSGMATATFLPNAGVFTHAEPFCADLAEDTFVMACELADALQIMEQCCARNIPLCNDFLGYVDDLTQRIQEMQPSHRICAA
jgi:hypothetical protein